MKYSLNDLYIFVLYLFFFKQKTAYEMRISDWSSDVCSSDLTTTGVAVNERHEQTDSAIHRLDEIGTNLDVVLVLDRDVSTPADEIGRASCRERVCQYV